MDTMMEKWGGGEILRRAVRGMLPKNRLREERMSRLKTFEGQDHPYKQNILKIRYQTPSAPPPPSALTTTATTTTP